MPLNFGGTRAIEKRIEDRAEDSILLVKRLPSKFPNGGMVVLDGDTKKLHIKVSGKWYLVASISEV